MMISSMDYLGPLVVDCGVPGETKADGIIPAHANGALQVSRDRWMLCVATLDPAGWDAVHSVIYQLRADAPNGPVLREGLLARCESGWQPLASPTPLRKIYGMPMAFGVPFGAVDAAGNPLAHAGHFAVKMYRYGLPERDSRILGREEAAKVWDPAIVKPEILRLEWLQFRFDPEADALVITQPLEELRQVGFEVGEAFCECPEARFMNHAMTPPIPADPEGLQWCEVDTFAGQGSHGTQGCIAPVEYTWDPAGQAYRWTRTGPLTRRSDTTFGETSISRFDGFWVIAARTWNRGGQTAWFRTEDLFAGLGAPTWHDTTWGPRHSYRCADGKLRILHNDQRLSPYGHKRNPLYIFEVDPVTFAYGEPEVVFDACEHLPFEQPCIDMAKLCPPQGNRQLVVFRAIDQTMTTDTAPDDPEVWQEWMRIAGVYAVELTFDAVEEPVWSFV